MITSVIVDDLVTWGTRSSVTTTWPKVAHKVIICTLHIISPYPCLLTYWGTKNGWHSADYIFKCISWKMLILKLVSCSSTENNTWLVQAMAWHQIGAKPLPEPMMIYALTYICMDKPKWVNNQEYLYHNLHSQLPCMTPVLTFTIHID